VKAITESRVMAEECLSEKAVVQNKLIDAENERDRLRIELNDCSVRCQNIEKSLMELQEKLVQRDQQVEHTDCELNYVRQQVTHFTETLVILQQQLKQEESEKMERKHQLKKLKKEIENLNQNLATQTGTVGDALAGKEESDKLTASLQLQVEHLTSEKVYLEQHIRILEDHNSSLKNDLSTITDSYENAMKLTAELQLRVDQQSAHEQNLSDQLSLLTTLCEQKDGVICQLNSEKEEISHSLIELKQKADADAVEITAHIKRISELEERNTVVNDKMEKLAADKQVLLDDLNTCRDVVEQKKQEVADAKRENEHFQKVISDFEEKSLHWRDEKLILECRIIELEKCVTVKEKEVEAMQERQEVERTSIDNLSLVKNSECVEITNKDLNDTAEHEMLEKSEVMENVDAVEQKSEVEKNVYDDCTSLLSPELASGNLREYPSLSVNLQEICEHADKHTNSIMIVKVEQESSSENELECSSRVEIDQVPSNEKFSSEAEKVNLQVVMSENAVMQPNEHFEPALKVALERVNAIYSLSENDKNVARDPASVDWNKQCNLNHATDSEGSLAVSNSHESAVSVLCVKDGSANKDLIAVEKVAHINDKLVELTRDPNVAVADTVGERDDLDTRFCGSANKDIEKVVHSNNTLAKTTRDSSVAVVDTASKRHDLDTQCDGRRKVIKRFTRLPRSSAASKHSSKPLSVSTSNVPNLHSRAAGSFDVNMSSAADAVKQLLDNKSLVANEASSSSLSVISSTVKSQDNTVSVPSSVPAVGVASDETCSTEICSVDATETSSSEYTSVCEQLNCPQAISECSHTTSEHRNSEMKMDPKCPVTRNVFVNNENSSDKSDPALYPSRKRLNTGVIGDHAKKHRSG